ncbi:MAG: ATP-grasp domain-containing protein [Eubacteriales bacterium]
MIAIVTDVQYKMSLALLRDLVAEGYTVIPCSSDKVLPPLGFSVSGVDRTVVLPDVGKSPHDYLQALLELAEECLVESEERPVILPIGAKTIGLLSSEDSLPLREKADFLIPATDTLQLLSDKGEMSKLATSLGVPIPPEICLDTDSYPRVVKPHCGEKYGLSARERYAIVQNATEQEIAVERYSSLEGRYPLVQQYLTGDGYGCSVLAREGEVLHMISHRRLREYPISGGPSSACVTVTDEVLERYTKILCKAVRLDGVAMFEFKGGPEEGFYFLEVNPRVWGTYPLTHVSGSSFTVDWARVSQGQECLGVAPTIGKRMHYLPTDCLGSIRYGLKGQWKKAFEGILAIFFVTDGVFAWKEPKANLSYLLALLFKKGGSHGGHG